MYDFVDAILYCVSYLYEWLVSFCINMTQTNDFCQFICCGKKWDHLKDCVQLSANPCLLSFLDQTVLAF